MPVSQSLAGLRRAVLCKGVKYIIPLFIGGDDAYKDGSDARSLCAVAKAQGKWVHWGRVNGKRRYELAHKAGADSIDGSGFSKWSQVNIPKAEAWSTAIHQQPELVEALRDR